MARQILGKVVPTGEDTYDNNRTYDELCIVMYNGQSYISKKETRGNKPDNTEYWQQLVEKPVKGTDYFTEADKDEIVNDVTNDATNKYNQAVKTGIETFNQNAERKTSDFNGNASEKTDTYNANADSATKTFTNNANSKTEAYNTNATEKLGTYNSNHTAKLKEYNDNATSKLNAYNTNTVTKTTEYNSNHTDKLNAYNTNASNKVDVYNTNADTRLEEYNTNADNKIAEYDEHSKELNNKIVSTRNELERLKSNVLNTGEDTDTFVHLEDSAMAELQEIKVDGVLSQETTNGYQLFDVSKVTNIYNGTIENEIVTSNALNGEGQGVTYNFPHITMVANTTYYIFADIRIKSGTGSVNGINNGVVGWEKVSFPSLSNNYNTFISKYTPTENKNIYAVYLGFKNANNLIINIQNVMITTDRNATYEPYTGGQSPNPDYPQEIKTITDSLKITSCGRNLLKNIATSATINGISFTVNDDGSVLANGTATADAILKIVPIATTFSQNLILSPNKTYTLSDSVGNYTDYFTQVVIQDANGNKKWYNTAGDIDISTNVITSLYTAQIYIRKDKTVNNVLFKPQLVVKDSANLFEPYIESQIQAKLPKGEFIGKFDETYKDTLRTKYFPEEGQYHWMLDKKIGKCVLNGSEFWEGGEYMRNNPDYVYFYTSAYDSLILNTNLNGLSTRFRVASKNKKLGITFPVEFDCFTNSADDDSSKIRIAINKNIINDLSTPAKRITSFRTWLSNNNDTQYFVLKTPYTLDLGVIDMPMSYKDITNIFTDSDLLPTINAKYYRVFDKTIQNAQINEKTLKQEITDLNATVSALDNRLKALETKTVEEPTESEGTV